jgi:hypothetical protein
VKIPACQRAIANHCRMADDGTGRVRTVLGVETQAETP